MEGGALTESALIRSKKTRRHMLLVASSAPLFYRLAVCSYPSFARVAHHSVPKYSSKMSAEFDFNEVRPLTFLHMSLIRKTTRVLQDAHSGFQW